MRSRELVRALGRHGYTKVELAEAMRVDGLPEAVGEVIALRVSGSFEGKRREIIAMGRGKSSRARGLALDAAYVGLRDFEHHRAQT